MVAETPIRVVSARNKSSKLIEPRYLEAMSLIMSDNLSATEAIKVVHTVDTVIWKQKHHLTLELDKAYTNAYAKVKNLHHKGQIVLKPYWKNQQKMIS